VFKGLSFFGKERKPWERKKNPGIHFQNRKKLKVTLAGLGLFSFLRSPVRAQEIKDPWEKRKKTEKRKGANCARASIV